MKKSEAVARAKEFLNSYIGEMYGHEEKFYKNFPDDYTFSDTELPYYVYLDSENYGCFSSESAFYSKEEVENLIDGQVCSDHREHWDNVVIFDIENNKVVKPTLK